jgi:hypothetical protein
LALFDRQEAVGGTSSTASSSGLPVTRGPAHPLAMGSKSRETICGASVRAAAERATKARKEADRLAVEAWNKRMLGFQGPAPPSPALGDAINAGFSYLEVKCLGCNTHQTVALDIVRRPKATPVHELERYMRCRQCSEVRGYPYKRNHLVAAREQDHGERSALDVVAPGAMTSLPELIPDVDFLFAMEECTGRDAIKMLRERGEP